NSVATNTANISTNTAAITEAQNDINTLETELDAKANKEEVDVALEAKTDLSTFNTTVTNINTALDGKASASSVTVLSESVTALSSSLSNKANIADVNEALAGKADSDHVHNYIHIGTEEPTDASVVLWVDTVNGLKYYDGSAWINVPMATS
ncbi:hypothetical protein, partial [Intestinibacter sp.]|uniref:hypothetical protein n=1 Tax=Intestinibacter sp. TaxID=1965304 RepID=UPI003F15C87E